LPSVTQANAPVEPSLQMMPTSICGWLSQPFVCGHGVVSRGGTHELDHWQAASFSLPQVWLANAVPVGHVIPGFAGHSASVQAR
jgi:hypothetical protein